ncbi:hypothetical protein FALBO_14134 [Fusarium albosuccineum]|uniref:Uncharacterized protein n=1 Tax=Fusarium albosuccineum TaxID=1237068 RepID=A0A8H4L0A4_9HYPO|nr:hypothetical protein FALBO_14134 [Fusarium albosuccineum]
MDQNRARLVELLGGRTVAQFASLPSEERQAVFRTHLVQSSPAVVDEEDPPIEVDMEDNYFDTIPVMAARGILLQPYLMGYDAIGSQLVNEARHVYYGENDFVMRLYSLRDFILDGHGGDIQTESLASLVTGAVTIVVALNDESNMFWECDSVDSEQGDLEADEEEEEFDPNAIDDISRDLIDPTSVHYRHGGETIARSAQKRLQDVFHFKNAKQITLAFQGNGLLDGSDLATHQTIKDLSYVVKLLIDHFGDRFTVMKILGTDDDDRFNGRVSPSRVLRSYWEVPSEDARQSVMRGDATFEQLMQVEIEEWTKVLPSPISEGEWKMLD